MALFLALLGKIVALQNFKLLSTLSQSYFTNKMENTKDPKCDICENVFGTKQKLKKHITTVHEKNEKVFSCNICTKSFHTEGGFTYHTKIFHGGAGKKHNCESCGKSFS